MYAICFFSHNGVEGGGGAFCRYVLIVTSDNPVLTQYIKRLDVKYCYMKYEVCDNKHSSTFLLSRAKSTIDTHEVLSTSDRHPSIPLAGRFNTKVRTGSSILGLHFPRPARTTSANEALAVDRYPRSSFSATLRTYKSERFPERKRTTTGVAHTAYTSENPRTYGTFDYSWRHSRHSPCFDRPPSSFCSYPRRHLRPNRRHRRRTTRASRYC